MLESEQITCTGLLPNADGQYTLLVGTHKGSVILWDTDTTNIIKV